MGRTLISVMAALSLVLAGCGDDGGDDVAVDGAADAATEPADDAPAAGGAGRGTLSLGDEAIDLDSVRCFLEEQPRAGLGGVFEHSIQAEGANSAGEMVILDITRVRPDPDEDPLGRDQEPSDHVVVDIGEPGAEDARSFRGSDEVGTVTVDGDTVTASGMSLTGEMDPSTGQPAVVEVSFDLECG